MNPHTSGRTENVYGSGEGRDLTMEVGEYVIHLMEGYIPYCVHGKFYSFQGDFNCFYVICPLHTEYVVL